MRSDSSFRPREIILEVTNHCNLRCRHCHFHGESAPVGKRKLGMMDPVIWKKVLTELAEWNVPATVLTHGAGEPLLYPHLRELLTHAKNIPHLSVGFMTNGMLLNRTWTEFILDIGMDFLAFSIDGTNPVTHDDVRVNADLIKIEANVQRLIEEKQRRGTSKPSLMFNMVAYPHIAAQGPEYVRRWIAHADTVIISTFRPVGKRLLWDPKHAPPFRPCPQLTRQCVIGWDGRLGLCCEDIFLEVSPGSVLDSSILAIYNESPVLCHYRSQHDQGSIDGLTLCKECHVWAGDIPLSKEKMIIDGMHIEKVQTPSHTAYRKEHEPNGS